MTLVRVLVGVLALMLLLLAVVRSWPQVRSTLETVGPAASVGALLAAAVASTLSALAFRVLMNGMHEGTTLRGDVEDFFASQLAKYLPGGIWAVAAQTELSADSGVPRSRSGAASVLNLALSLAAAAVLGPLAGARSGWPRVAAVGLALAVFLAVVLIVLPRVVAGRSLQLSPGRLATAGGLALAIWVAYGVHLGLLVHASGTDRPVGFGTLVGTFALAWASGLVAVIAPAGIGVREVVLVSLLSPVLSGGHAAALAVAVLSRFLITVSDAALGLTATASRRRRRAARAR
jgi:hypothetical protein